MTLLSDLRELTTKWSELHDFLANPEDTEADRAAGEAYEECCDELLLVIEEHRELLFKKEGEVE